MTIDEAIKIYGISNAEYERTHGNLQGYLDFKQLAEWLIELKELRERTRWIPTDERQPEESGKYLVSVMDSAIENYCNTEIALAWFAHPKDYDISEGEWRELMKYEIVVAWMPSPESYKPEKDCNNCEYYTDADEIHGMTPCGDCGCELKNFKQKRSIEE